MTDQLIQAGGGHGGRWRVIGWGVAVGLLILPFIAMRFTGEVNWTASDFVFAAVLLGSVGLGMEFAVRRSSSAAGLPAPTRCRPRSLPSMPGRRTPRQPTGGRSQPCMTSCFVCSHHR